MSRSRKRTPITSITTAESASVYKKQRARLERARQRLLLSAAQKGDERAQEKLEVEQARWNEWLCERDGKMWVGDMLDDSWIKKAMRK